MIGLPGDTIQMIDGVLNINGVPVGMTRDTDFLEPKGLEGEVMSLAAAGMTGAGYYWSSTPADTFGDKHLVWYGKRARVLEREQANFAMCVRGSVDDG